MLNYTQMQIAAELWFSMVCLLVTIVTGKMIAHRKKKSSHMMLGLFCVIVTTMFSDVFCMLFNGVTTQVGFIATRVANFLNYMANPITLLLVFFYLVCIVKEADGEVAVGWKALMLLDTCGMCVLVIISQFTNILYRIDEKNIYIRGPLYDFEQVMAIMGMALFIFCVSRHQKYLERMKLFTLIIYILFPIFAIIIQLFMVGPYLTLSMGITILVMFADNIIDVTREKESQESQDENILKEAKQQNETFTLDVRAKSIKHIFIVNPEAGGQNEADEFRKKLTEFKGLDYFIFNTRGRGREQELVQKILTYFPNEKLRIYCCGGSGTFRNVLDGIPKEMLSSIEMAFFPMGLSNDFLKAFGDAEKHFTSIEKIINGQTHTISYIRTNHGSALNTFSVGLDANINAGVDKYKHLSMFGSQFPYLYSIFTGLFLSEPQEYDLWIDEEHYVEKFAEIIFGNGNCIGGMLYFTDAAGVFTKRLKTLLVRNRKSFGLIGLMMALTKKDMKEIDRYATRGVANSFKISRKDHKPFVMNFDGEMIGPYEEWSGEIIQDTLRIILPREVSLYE